MPKIGVLIIGIGGNNGVTLIAGAIANKKKLSWESIEGTERATYTGCITQVPSKGRYGGVGFKDEYDLPNFNDAEISGWDVRDKKLGEALYECRVLDYDLVRQVREEMNEINILPGVYDPSFIGESQHKGAVNIIAADSYRSKLEIVRQHIRDFRAEKKIDGHISVIWSASVERPCEGEFASVEDLMSAIEDGKKEVSPSIIYALAAIQEGCSFINGGSQNTICPALMHLAKDKGVYLLGTDYKAGQTKFKTAAVEYIRTNGMEPIVIASSNHLGNNDMLNLKSKKTLGSKMRVKSDIFEAWQEDIDHQVTVMYTKRIGDEKRDFVEYTSKGFLGSRHTMVTYTRCMDSILCVPLMIDSTVWCSYFYEKSVPSEEASKALAYLFKVPEGDAKGVDPGFFFQMEVLKECLKKTKLGPAAKKQRTR